MRRKTLIHLVALLAASLVCITHYSARGDNPPPAQPSSGKPQKEADLEKQMQIFKEGRAKPVLVIPFEQLGPRWKAWQKQDKKGKLGYYAKKQSDRIGVGFLPMGSEEIHEEDGVTFWDWADTDKPGHVTTYSKTAQFYNLALGQMSLTTELVTPLHGRAFTADGSIIAFKTDGMELLWLKRMSFVSEGDDTLYFGVIERLGGLVHLGGKGKCTIRSEGAKKETILK